MQKNTYRQPCRVCQRETAWQHSHRRNAQLECAEHRPVYPRAVVQPAAPEPEFADVLLPLWALEAIQIRDDARRRDWRIEQEQAALDAHWADCAAGVKDR